MDIQEIEVIINEDGQVTLHVSGIQGNSCMALTSELEQSLGNLILERQMTSEASESKVVSRKIVKRSKINPKLQ